MRIGIDCRDILLQEKGEAGGIGRYVHELVRALIDIAPHEEFVLFFDDHDAARAKRSFARDRGNVTARVLPFHSFRKIPLLRSHGLVSALFLREGLDLLHGPANSLPLFYRGPAVVTVHDLAVYDHPEWFPAALPGARTFSERVVVPRSVAAAKRVIAVSGRTKLDIARLFGNDPGKIDVVYEGVTAAEPPHDLAAALGRMKLREKRFVLSLSTLEPRKNIPATISGFTRAAMRGLLPDDCPLVIAGGDGWKTEPIVEAIAEAQAELGRDRVRRLGRVTEAERAALMAGAGAFVYPSFYEGFGLPPLEAMAAGTPVIVSDAGSLPEVCGDAAYAVNPYDPDAIAEGLAEIFADAVLAAKVSAAGRAHAAGFTWEKAARATLETYRNAVGT
jgi:alpha-1,3-rhamnosyl/mannosyltransferase